MDANKTASTLADFVNAFNFDGEGFVNKVCYGTHRTLQQSIGKLVFMLIRKWADCYDKGIYDGRNEALCKSCKSIVETMDKEDEYWDSLPLI
jgi:hypothetical protein